MASRSIRPVADLDARLAAGHQVDRADADDRRLGLLGQPPQPVQLGPRRVAVEEHDRRAEQQRADERVPHHPGGRRRLQQPVARLDVPGQPEVLVVLEHDAAVAVHDRLRQARSCRRRRARTAGGRTRTGIERRARRRASGIAGADHVLERRQRARGSRRAPRGGRSTFPRCVYSSTAISTFGSIWANRSITLRGPNSGETLGPDGAEARRSPGSTTSVSGTVREVGDDPVAAR